MVVVVLPWIRRSVATLSKLLGPAGTGDAKVTWMVISGMTCPAALTTLASRVSRGSNDVGVSEPANGLTVTARSVLPKRSGGPIGGMLAFRTLGASPGERNA